MRHQPQSFWFSSKGLAALGLIAAVSYFLFVEHREHVFEAFPYLILLLCPLMHIFMHHGHGHRGGHDHHEHREETEQDAYQRGLEEGRRERQNRHHH